VPIAFEMLFGTLFPVPETNANKDEPKRSNSSRFSRGSLTRLALSSIEWLVNSVLRLVIRLSKLDFQTSLLPDW
jgi:hypothetical protein